MISPPYGGSVTLPEIKEDLIAMAGDAYVLAQTRCGTCRDTHALWPYLRIGRIGSGVEGGRVALDAALGEAFSGGAVDVLIAGAADTGILCLAANARGGRHARYTIIDVCPTPLELCERFAREWSLKVGTKVLDAMNLDLPSAFDVVIAHSLLQFLPREKHLELFTRFASALKPGGKLVQVFNTSRRIAGAMTEEYRTHYADWVLTQLEAMNIPLPVERERFRAELTRRGLRRERREGLIESEDQVTESLRAAGFAIESCREIEQNLSPAYTEFVAKIARRRFLCVSSIPKLR